MLELESVDCVAATEHMGQSNSFYGPLEMQRVKILVEEGKSLIQSFYLTSI